MKLSELFPNKSKFYNTTSITEPTKVIIAGIEFAEFERDGKTEKEPRLLFDDGKVMSLNKTNATMLSNLFGDETDKWTGKEIVIYVDPNVRNPEGKKTGGVRVRGA